MADALAEWAQRQKALLSDAYDRAWQRGVARYTPEEEPSEQDQHERDAAGAVARGRTPYIAPTAPDPERKRKALHAPNAGIDRMHDELAEIQTTPVRGLNKQEREEVERGAAPAPSIAHAMSSWADSNMFRIGTSIGAAVWGGEQTGFAAAAGADGQMLVWVCAEDAQSCGDCLNMAETPPTLESNWPYFPGTGGTVCGGNCRCTMDYASAAELTEPTTQGGEP